MIWTSLRILARCWNDVSTFSSSSGAKNEEKVMVGKSGIAHLDGLGGLLLKVWVQDSLCGADVGKIQSNTASPEPKIRTKGKEKGQKSAAGESS